MSHTIYDIIIVGGGPAGSICGIFLKKNNPDLRVAIIEKQFFPREKVCGDGLSPGAVQIIEEAGLGCVFQDRLAINTFCLSLNGKRKIYYDLNRLPDTGCRGYVYPRKSLDHALIKRATTLGVDILEGHSIHKIEEQEDFCTSVTCVYQSSIKKIKAPLLIGADGSNSVIRKYLTIASNKDINTGVALRGYCNYKPGAVNALYIDILKNMGGAYGWLFPISSTLANVGIGIDLAVYKKKRLNINKEFKKYFSQIQQESKLVLIENSCAGFTLPYGNEMPALYSGNKVIIGDAASMINPLTGEGIFYAMQAGKMLACHVASCTGSAPRLTKALADFSDSYKKSFEEHFRLNLMLKKILASPFAGFAFKKIASQEQVLDKAMNIIMGNGSHLSSSNFKIRLLKKMTGVK